MSAPARRVRRAKFQHSIAGYQRWSRQWQRRYRHASRPGYGMGMGANTLIHKGGKP